MEFAKDESSILSTSNIGRDLPAFFLSHYLKLTAYQSYYQNRSTSAHLDWSVK